MLLFIDISHITQEILGCCPMLPNIWNTAKYLLYHVNNMNGIALA
jgi:hypothetical protein